LSLKNKSANFGMNLIMSMTPYWNHAESPLDYLQVNESIAWFRAKLESQPNFLEQLVKDQLVDNKHKLVQSMVPATDYQTKEEEQQLVLEEELRSSLGDAEKSELHLKCVNLAKSQGREEDSSCLPSLRVEDIDSQYIGVKLDHLDAVGCPLQVTNQPCNGVSYFRAMLPTSSLPASLVPLLPIFSSVLTKLGAGNMDCAALDTAIERRTGGLSATTHVQESPSCLSTVSSSLLLSSYCLDSNISNMFDLWSQIFSSVHWNDTTRLATLLKMYASAANNGLAQSGHSYAMSAAASSLSPAAAASEQFSGMTNLSLLTRLSQEDANQLAKKLQTIASHLMTRTGMKVALNSSDTDTLVTSTSNFLSTLPVAENTSSISSSEFKPESRNQHYVTAFPINFTSQSVPTVPYTSSKHAPLTVLAALLSSKYLHSEIREKGGAYGGGAVAGSGSFTYYSYRDPNNLETFTVYRNAAEWATNTSNYGENEVQEAVLRCFQKLDSPLAPGQRGLRAWLSGIQDEQFAEHRRRVKAVKVSDVAAAAEEFLLTPHISGKALIGGANKNLDELGWKVHNP